MKLFKIVPDTADYGSLEIFNTKELMKAFGVVKYRKLRSVQSAIVDKWPESHGDFYDINSLDAEPMPESPDLAIWMNVFLVLSPRARAVLGPSLNCFGEFLPFSCNDQEYAVFAVHGVIEPELADSKAIEESGIYAGVSSLVFKPEAVGTHTIFKTEFDKFSQLYCSESFKQTVESKGLIGLSFSPDLSSRL